MSGGGPDVLAFGHHARHAKTRCHDLKRLLKRGRASLMIGLAFVAACLLGAEAIGKLQGSPVLMVARESLLIVGWVAMWRLLAIFLYDWWPLARWIRVYRNLSHAHVHVVQGK
jgi:hypothetical protein